MSASTVLPTSRSDVRHVDGTEPPDASGHSVRFPNVEIDFGECIADGQCLPRRPAFLLPDSNRVCTLIKFDTAYPLIKITFPATAAKSGPISTL